MTTTDQDYETSNTAKGNRVAAATGKVREKASAVGQKVSETLDSARDRAAEAYDSARERGEAAYASARQGASRAKRNTVEGVDSNPGLALLGGLAVGALLAAVLPKTRRETKALGDIGRRINTTAKDAARAAKDAGREKLGELGYTGEAAKKKLSEIASGAGEAVRTSASAAAQRVKG